MSYSASVKLMTHGILKTCLVVKTYQLRSYKVAVTGDATPLKLQEQIHNSVITENVTNFSSMEEVYRNLAARVFDIDTAQLDAGHHDIAVVELQDVSTNIPEDVTKLTRWGSGVICVVIHTRTEPIFCKCPVVDDTPLSRLYGA